MKLRFFFAGILCILCVHLKAQNTNNIYDDVQKLKQIRGTAAMLSMNNADQWIPIIKKYVPIANQITNNTIIQYIKNNPIIKAAGNFFPDTAVTDSTERIHFMSANVTIPIANLFTGVATSGSTSPGFTTSSVADALTQLIIERGKEELTATFFEQLKTELKNNPELSAAFPTTTAFISQIEPYLYASYLTTLREAFFQDINNLPFEVGAILRTPRIKNFISQNPGSKDVWLVVPAIKCLGDLHNGKSIADAIKGLYPDDELFSVSPDYYNTLKMAVILSESARDVTGKQNWVNFTDFQNMITNSTDGAIFLGLLYEEAKYTPPGSMIIPITNYITTANQTKIVNLVKNFTVDYNTANETFKAYKDIKDTSQAGRPVNFKQVITLLNSSELNLKQTFDLVNTLAPVSAQVNVDANIFFKDFPNLITILGNFNDKKYASGIMNTMILIDQFIAAKSNNYQPFKSQSFINSNLLNKNNLKASIQEADNTLNSYAKLYPKENIKSLIKSLTDIKITTPPNDDQLKETEKIFNNIASYSNDFDANDTYQKLLKYASLMAALSEAQTTADITSALDAAILPAGSSSIKYYTAFSFSLNSYIGASYYRAYYSSPTTNGKLYLNTLGVALPIGVNFSVSTRGNVVGALSLFVSVVDLGAVASYRLNNPPNVSSQTLPDFTLQNLIAPGGFVVLNRLFKTPLAIGIGAQRAPQLSSITDGTADISKNQTWRFGAFLSVDIPLFNVYSKSLKRPIN